MKSRHHCVRCNVHCYSLYPTKPSPPNVVLIQFTHKGKAALWWFWPQRALGKEIVTGACPEKEGVNQRFSNPSQASSVKYTWYQKNCVCAFCFNVWGGFWSWWGKNPSPSTCYLSLFSEFLLCQVTFFFFPLWPESLKTLLQHGIVTSLNFCVALEPGQFVFENKWVWASQECFVPVSSPSS